VVTCASLLSLRKSAKLARFEPANTLFCRRETGQARLRKRESCAAEVCVAAFRQKKSIKVLLTKVREKAGRRRRRRRRRYQQTLTLISFVQKLSASQKK